MLCYFSCPPVSGRTQEQNHAAQLLSQMNLKINTYCQCNFVDITVISILRLTSTLHLQCVLQHLQCRHISSMSYCGQGYSL